MEYSYLAGTRPGMISRKKVVRQKNTDALFCEHERVVCSMQKSLKKKAPFVLSYA